MMHTCLLLSIPAAVISCTAAASTASKPAVEPAAKPAAARPVDNKAFPGQLHEFDVARQLVDQLGFNAGLPENPVTQDLPVDTSYSAKVIEAAVLSKLSEMVRTTFKERR